MHPNYSKRQILIRFNIKLNAPASVDANGNKIKSVSHSSDISGFYKYINDDALANDIINKAMKSKNQIYHRKLIRGSIIRFYNRMG